MDDANRTDAPEQDAYARWLGAFVRLGFALLAMSFFLYVTGIVPAAIAPARLPELWSLPLDQYLAAAHAPTGWSWLRRLSEGDLLNLVGVAVLNFATLACYLRVLPVFARAGRRGFVAICAVQVIVLGAAAAGMFTR
jgi:hypothetical protein